MSQTGKGLILEREDNLMNRLALPFVIPVGVIVATLLIIFIVSRILLGVPREVAVPLAMFMAVAILIGSAFVALTGGGSAGASRSRGSSRSRR